MGRDDYCDSTTLCVLVFEEKGIDEGGDDQERKNRQYVLRVLTLMMKQRKGIGSCCTRTLPVSRIIQSK